MIIIFDRDIDPNIVSIMASGKDCNKYIYLGKSGNGWGIDDKTGFTISIGAETVIFTFANGESMQPYIHQLLESVPTSVYPSLQLNHDMFYDRPQTGEIVSHTYDVDGDIEKELINGTFKE
jgi:hypothetical protein